MGLFKKLLNGADMFFFLKKSSFKFWSVLNEKNQHIKTHLVVTEAK